MTQYLLVLKECRNKYSRTLQLMVLTLHAFCRYSTRVLIGSDIPLHRLVCKHLVKTPIHPPEAIANQAEGVICKTITGVEKLHPHMCGCSGQSYHTMQAIHTSSLGCEMCRAFYR